MEDFVIVRYILLAAFSSWRKTLTMTGVLLFIPGYNLCMENNLNYGKREVEQVAPKLPMEEFLNKTVTQHLVNLIKEYENSKDENRLKIFLNQFLDLQLVNKQVKSFLVEPNGKKNKYFAPSEPLLVVAVQLNSNILCELILQNSKITQEELDCALIFAATNQNRKIFDLLIKHGAKYLLPHSFISDYLLSGRSLSLDLDKLFLRVVDVSEYAKNHSISSIKALSNIKTYFVVKFCILNGFNGNAKCSNNFFPIITIIYMQHDNELINLLLRYGADPNNSSARGLSGETALIAAAHCAKKETVRSLLNYKADKTIKVAGKTAYDYAMSGNREDIAELLK